jgi:Fic family protein
LTIVTRTIKNHRYLYYQDVIQLGSQQSKILNTLIGRADLPATQLIERKGRAFVKHFIKILQERSVIRKVDFRFENRPTEIGVDVLELIKAMYKVLIHNLTIEEREGFEKAIFTMYVNGSTAIEGNSLDVGQTYNLVYLDLSPSNKSTQEIIEVSNYRMIGEYLETYRGGINEKMIRTLHKLIMNGLILVSKGYEEPGKYREIDVAIVKSLCRVPHYVDVPKEILKLLDWYDEGLEKKVHPLELAAMFHQKFECIHPFQDGNGRTGRAILDYMLRSADFPSIYIPREKRNSYLDALNEADLGNYVPLIDFIVSRILSSLRYLISKTSWFNIFNSREYAEIYTKLRSEDIYSKFLDLITIDHRSKDLP